MTNFKKVLNTKKIAITIGIVFLFNTNLYSHPDLKDFIRIPIGDKVYRRIEMTRRVFVAQAIKVFSGLAILPKVANMPGGQAAVVTSSTSTAPKTIAVPITHAINPAGLTAAIPAVSFSALVPKPVVSLPRPPLGTPNIVADAGRNSLALACVSGIFVYDTDGKLVFSVDKDVRFGYYGDNMVTVMRDGDRELIVFNITDYATYAGIEAVDVRGNIIYKRTWGDTLPPDAPNFMNSFVPPIAGRFTQQVPADRDQFLIVSAHKKTMGLDGLDGSGNFVGLWNKELEIYPSGGMALIRDTGGQTKAVVSGQHAVSDEAVFLVINPETGQTESSFSPIRKGSTLSMNLPGVPGLSEVTVQTVELQKFITGPTNGDFKYQIISMMTMLVTHGADKLVVYAVGIIDPVDRSLIRIEPLFSSTNLRFMDNNIGPSMGFISQGDKTPIIVAGFNNSLVVLDSAGRTDYTLPGQIFPNSVPLIADFSGQGNLTIAVATNNGKIVFIDPKSQVVNGDAASFNGEPVGMSVYDDGKGEISLVLITSGQTYNLYRWGLPGNVIKPGSWPSPRYDKTFKAMFYDPTFVPLPPSWNRLFIPLAMKGAGVMEAQYINHNVNIEFKVNNEVLNRLSMPDRAVFSGLAKVFVQQIPDIIKLGLDIGKVAIEFNFISDGRAAIAEDGRVYIDPVVISAGQPDSLFAWEKVISDLKEALAGLNDIKIADDVKGALSARLNITADSEAKKVVVGWGEIISAANEWNFKNVYLVELQAMLGTAYFDNNGIFPDYKLYDFHRRLKSAKRSKLIEDIAVAVTTSL